MSREMGEQPDVLASLVARWETHCAAVAAIVPRPLAGVVFLARGSSHNAALLGRYAVELASGRPAGLVAPSVHTRYQSFVDYSGYLVVALSQSGETPEIVTTSERLRESGARVVAITNGPVSSLVGAADLTLSLDAGEERAVPATKTVTAQMLLVLAVAASLGRIPVEARDLIRLPAAVAEVLSDPSPARALVSRWSEQRRLLVSARGLLVAASVETALKVKETAGVFAQGMSSADLLHGPIAAVADVPILTFVGPGQAGSDVDAVIGRLRAMGEDVAVCSTSPSAELPLPPGLPEPLDVLVATVRGQQVARDWALAAGRDPDAPLGLTKVTATT
jgi:glucosamine--fructose-6-phosphate aminotransferase (isomerizing)